MNILGLIFKNPFRNKTRSLLAITGIAIGIATIVALGMVTASLESSTETNLKEGSAEITAMKVGALRGSTSGNLNYSYVDELAQIAGVNRTAGSIETSVASKASSPDGLAMGYSLYGMQPDTLDLIGITDINGSLYANNSNELIIGKSVAEQENYTLGDTIDVYGTDYKITGIYETGSLMNDVSMYTSLENVQNLTDNQNKVSSISIKINKDTSIDEVNNKIKTDYNNTLTTITSQEMENTINDTLNTISTMTTAIELLAIVIGGLGVINTMMMTVFERTREIGVLKSVGWNRLKILTMILGESIVITLISGIIGSIVGFLAVILLFKFLGGDAEVSYNIYIFIKAFSVAILVGIIGGLYPAIKASKLSPTEALRYE